MTRIIPIDDELPPLEGDGEQNDGEIKTSKSKRKLAGERFKTLNTFVDFGLAKLSRVEIAVWLILFRDTRDGTARTSYDDLAQRAGCNRRGVGRAIRRLEMLDMLGIVYRGGFRRGVSRYRVHALPKDG